MAVHPVRIALLAALSIMLVRLLLFVANVQWTYLDNMLLLVVLSALIPLTIYAIWPRNQEEGLIVDLKNALRITLPYSILVVVLLAIYYVFVDTEYFTFMQEGILSRSLDENAEQDPVKMREQVSSFFSIRNFSLIVLVILLVLSLFYAIVFSAVKRLFFKRAVR